MSSMTLSILIVGLVRNAEKTLHKDIEIFSNAFSDFADVKFFLVESDSSDKTIDVLNFYKSKDSSFDYVSLGNLREKHPLRTDRIAVCRNEYVRRINELDIYSNINYVVVADLDNVNNLLNKDSVNSCWESVVKWDVCTANQRGAYYDIYALRHKVWNPSDCFEQKDFLMKFGVKLELSSVASVYAKMIQIPPDNEWIEVDSAFGGLAIYKKELFKGISYCGLTESGKEVCEHTIVHQIMKEKGAKIFINPRLINGGFNEHSIHTKVQFKFYRLFWRILNVFLVKLGIKDLLKSKLKNIAK